MTTELETQPNEIAVKDGALLPLDSERCVSFFDRGHPYTLYFSRILQRDWERYFSGINFTSHNEGRQQVDIRDIDTAALQMVEEKITRVEGYRGDFATRDKWQQLLPVRHTRPAVYLLRSVVPSADKSEAFDPEQFEAVIDAAWGILGPGKMLMYTGLIHRFRPLTADHKRRYCRATSETRVVGGSRNSRTIYVPRQPMLLKIYDELVINVEGYSVSGKKLATAEDAVREMDAYHKVVAAQQLFMGSNDEIADEVEEGEVA